MNTKFSRRQLSFLLPALAARAAAQQAPAAQQAAAAKPAPPLPELLTSRVYPSDKIPYTGNEQKKGRRFLVGATHTGFHVEVHETVLGAGLETHPPHKHEHEEFVIVVEGTVEANLDGNKQTVPAGSILFFGSNQTHNARNVGTTPCRYYVVELRGSEA